MCKTCSEFFFLDHDDIIKMCYCQGKKMRQCTNKVILMNLILVPLFSKSRYKKQICQKNKTTTKKKNITGDVLNYLALLFVGPEKGALGSKHVTFHFILEK